MLKPDATVPESSGCAPRPSNSVSPAFASIRVTSPLRRDPSRKRCQGMHRGRIPLGSTSTAAKAFETEQAIRDGRRSDMVVNVGMLKSEMWSTSRRTFSQSPARSPFPCSHEVILETGLLTDEEKVKACILAKRAGADFVKTSTDSARGRPRGHCTHAARGRERNGVKASGASAAARMRSPWWPVALTASARAPASRL